MTQIELEAHCIATELDNLGAPDCFIEETLKCEFPDTSEVKLRRIAKQTLSNHKMNRAAQQRRRCRFAFRRL